MKTVLLGALLLSGLAWGQSKAKPQTFVISGCPKDGTRVTVTPKLTKEGLLDAIAASGCTVWTEKNWIDASIDEQPQLWTFQDEHLTWLHAAGHSCGLFSCDEPAIHVPVKSWMHMETNCNEDSDICIDGATACSNHGHPDYIDKQENTLPLGRKCLDGWIWGCADETRILEKAQNGDAWCHAPMLNK